MFIDKEHSWFLDCKQNFYQYINVRNNQSVGWKRKCKGDTFSQSGYGVFWRVAIREPVLKNIK